MYPSIRALLPKGIFLKLGKEFALIEEQFIDRVIRLDRLLDTQLGNWSEETFEVLGTVKRFLSLHFHDNQENRPAKADSEENYH